MNPLFYLSKINRVVEYLADPAARAEFLSIARMGKC
jgi:hypothetical protein